MWSPDSKMIAFTSDTSPEDLAKQHKKDSAAAKDKSQGRSEAKSETKPDSKEDDKPEAGPAAAKPADSADGEHESHESDVRVITRSVYRINGGGYLDYKHPEHIWVDRHAAKL